MNVNYCNNHIIQSTPLIDISRGYAYEISIDMKQYNRKYTIKPEFGPLNRQYYNNAFKHSTVM